MERNGGFFDPARYRAILSSINGAVAAVVWGNPRQYDRPIDRRLVKIAVLVGYSCLVFAAPGEVHWVWLCPGTWTWFRTGLARYLPRVAGGNHALSDPSARPSAWPALEKALGGKATFLRPAYHAIESGRGAIDHRGNRLVELRAGLHGRSPYSIPRSHGLAKASGASPPFETRLFSALGALLRGIERILKIRRPWSRGSPMRYALPLSASGSTSGPEARWLPISGREAMGPFSDHRRRWDALGGSQVPRRVHDKHASKTKSQVKSFSNRPHDPSDQDPWIPHIRRTPALAREDADTRNSRSACHQIERTSGFHRDPRYWKQ